MENESGYLKKVFDRARSIYFSNLNGQKKYYCLLGLLLCIMSLYSLQTLTTKPRIWADEGLSLELSHNFMIFGKIDVQTAPGIFSGLPEYLQSTGYPVLAPAALFFKIFGFGFVQARVYMLLWMIITISAIFIFLKNIFNFRLALLSILLITTFASFYANGRSLVGEIPGFFFLVIGLCFWWIKEKRFIAGIFFGLAVVSKPSVYLNALPVIGLVAIKYEKKDFWRNAILIVLGTLPAAIIWVSLVIPHPFQIEPWARIAHFYRDPYTSVSMTNSIIKNVFQIPRQLSIIYFIILCIPIILTFFKLSDKKIKCFYYFIILYSLLSFFYFLRSPGWIRYLIASQILILMLFPFAIENIILKIKERLAIIKRFKPILLHSLIIIFLAIVQTAQLFLFSHIYASDAALKATRFVTSNFQNQSIGLINMPEIAAFVNPAQKFQVINKLLGIPELGDVNSWPPTVDVIVVYESDDLGMAAARLFLNRYKLINNIDGYKIFGIAHKEKNI